MGYLGKLTHSGRLTADNPVLAGGWAISFTPADIGIRIPSEVYHIAIKGPAGSQFEVWIDTTFYDVVKRGDVNSWDPNQPMFLDPGATIFFYFNTAAAGVTAPKASLFFREPSPI